MAWHFDKVLTKEIATIEMGPFCYAPEIRLSKDLPITAQEAFRESQVACRRKGYAAARTIQAFAKRGEACHLNLSPRSLSSLKRW
jgi:hypothetical protein